MLTSGRWRLTMATRLCLLFILASVATGNVIITEIMQNPSVVTDDNGEWFELYNPSGTDIDINGWTISDNDSDSHTIDNGGPLLVPAGGYLVLGINGDSNTNGGVSLDYVYASITLANGADELVLTDTSSVVIDRVEWDGGPIWPDPTGASMSLSFDSGAYAVDNNDGSNWCEGVDTYGDGDSGTPGAENPSCGSTGGTTVAPPTLTTIPEIQGRGQVSPLVGQSVTTQGIVTAVDNNGFYMQDALGDDDIGTSDAIFVFTSSAPSVLIGDFIEVTGSVSEFTPGGTFTRNLSTTQISGGVSITVLNSGLQLPFPIILGPGGRIPPSEVYHVDNLETYDPENYGVDFFESLEGMLVAVPNPIVIAGTNRFGEIFAVANRGQDATGLSERGTLNLEESDFNPERIQIDVDGNIFSTPTPTVDVGAELSDIIGVLSFNFGNFEIIPTTYFYVTEPSTLEPVSVSRDDPFMKEKEKKNKGSSKSGGKRNSRKLERVAQEVGTSRRVRKGSKGGKGSKSSDYLYVASYNVLNLDPNDSDGDTDIADGRFDANAEIIAKNMDCPDIVGLQEIQDNTGSDNGDGITSASETLQLLVDSIATVSANSCKYMFLDNIFIGEGTSGGQPGGNIRTAFLYDPTRVKYIEGSLNAVTDPIDQQTNSENPFFGGRLPLAAKFMHIETQTYFEVVNNHFSSKGGSAPIMGVEQPFDERQEDPNINGSLDERQAQSEAVRQYLLPKATAHENFIVMGDLNEFEFISPVEGLTVGTGLKNLADDVPSLERYSFIFQGNSQVLDHILVSEYFAEAGSYMKYVHVNSEFAETDERASDHDPVVAWIPLD